MNLLFVCSRNKWRSRTAETIFKKLGNCIVKSAGTSEKAVVKLTEKHLHWANLVFVMEEKHQRIINKKFKSKEIDNKIIVLGIPDHYQYMDEELIEILESIVGEYL